MQEYLEVREEWVNVLVEGLYGTVLQGLQLGLTVIGFL